MLSLYFLFSACFIWIDRKYFTYDSAGYHILCTYISFHLSFKISATFVAVDVPPDITLSKSQLTIKDAK